MTASAEELYRRGVEDGNSRRFLRARRHLESALARAEEADLAAKIRGTLAYILGMLGESDEAQRLCREALRVAGTSRSTRAVVNGQLGTLLMHAGESDEAIRRLSQAIAELSEDPTSSANLLMNRAVALMQEHRLAESVADLRRAVPTFEAAGDRTGAAQARHNLGYVALLGGDIVTALREMNAAREELERVSPAVTAICDLDRAEALREAGLAVEAEETLDRVAHTFGAQRMPQARGEAELQLARSLLTHEPARAERIARAAARRFRRVGSDAWAARAEAIALRAGFAAIAAGAAQRGGGSRRRRGAAVGEEVARTVAELRSRGLRSDAAALRLAYDAARARAGDPPARLAPVRADDPLEVRLLAHEARAARATARGHDAEAGRYAAAGLSELTEWQRSFGSIELLSSVAMHGRGLVLEGHRAALRSGRPEVVFEWSERARHFSQQVTPVRPPHDPELAADLAQLRMLRAELSSAEWTGDPRVAELRRRMRARQWASIGAAAGPPRVELDALRAELDDDTAVLSYVPSPDGLFCLVVPAERRGAPQLIELPWGRIRALGRGLHAELDAAAAVGAGPAHRVLQTALDTRLAELSRALVERALSAAGDPRRIVLTASAALHTVPWGMLPALRGRSLTLAPSASRWVSAGRRPLDSPVSAGFAAGPGVARGAEEVERASAAWWAEAERRSPGSGDGSVRVLGGERAGIADVTALAEEVDLLHVVAHGRHAAMSPLLSGVDLADGTLFGYDIDLIRRPPSVVVLSACEVGRSSAHWGEEAIGMARTWLHAGTRCVVAAPVTVADDVACELLSAMHEGLAARLDPAEALAEATAETGLVTPFLCHGAGF